MRNKKLSFDTNFIFTELNELSEDKSLEKAVSACVEAQKLAASSWVKDGFRENPQARREVSEESLGQILKTGKDVNGIRTEREISNVVIFNDASYENAVISEELKKFRAEVDQLATKVIRRIYAEGRRIFLSSSGFFLYPPGGYMGWHTNAGKPDWRLYINYVEEPGKSFFRYRDPDTGKVVTSMDKRLNFRLFRVSAEKPFWHAVYSDTNRFSFGYRVRLAEKAILPLRIKNRVLDLLGV